MNVTLKFSGRIDAEAAPKVQKMIEDELLKASQDLKSINLTLDATNLSYISSAGLRILLSLKKKTAGLSVVNASAEVCDIFNVTGFDNFITISGKLKEVSIDGLVLVGAGRNSKTYRLDKEKVIKVYNEDVAYETVLREQELTKKAIGLGIDTVISYGVVSCAGSFGAIYEMLDAKSIMEWIKSDPDNEDLYLKKFVDFVKKNHEIKITGSEIKSIKKRYYDRIDMLMDSGSFTHDEAMSARQIIFSIPDKDNYVHGDCHIANVMYSKKTEELFFLDLPEFSKGNPIFDIFGMAWLRLAPKVLDNDELIKFTNIKPEALERIWKKLLSYYFDTTDNSIIDELDKIYTALECLHLSMAEIFAPGLFTPQTLEWLKEEGLVAAKYDF